MTKHTTPLIGGIPGGSAIKSYLDGEDIPTTVSRAGLSAAAASAMLYPGYQLYRSIPGSVYKKIDKSPVADTTKKLMKTIGRKNRGRVEAALEGQAEALPGVGKKLLRQAHGRKKLLAALLGGTVGSYTGGVTGDAVFDQLQDAGDISPTTRKAVDVASKAGLGAAAGSTIGWVPDKFLGRLAKTSLGKGTIGALLGAAAGATYSGMKPTMGKEAAANTPKEHSSSLLALIPALGPSYKSISDSDTADQTTARSVMDTIGSIQGAITGSAAAGYLRHRLPEVNIPLLKKVIKAPSLLKTLGIGALVGHGIGSVTADATLDKIIK